MGDLGSIPELRRCPGGGHGRPLQYSSLENRHGQRSLAGYSPGGRKELDTTEWLSAYTHTHTHTHTHTPTSPEGAWHQSRREEMMVVGWPLLWKALMVPGGKWPPDVDSCWKQHCPGAFHDLGEFEMSRDCHPNMSDLHRPGNYGVKSHPPIPTHNTNLSLSFLKFKLNKMSLLWELIIHLLTWIIYLVSLKMSRS